jgi:hypothetical protein
MLLAADADVADYITRLDQMGEGHWENLLARDLASATVGIR